MFLFCCCCCFLSWLLHVLNGSTKSLPVPVWVAADSGKTDAECSVTLSSSCLPLCCLLISEIFHSGCSFFYEEGIYVGLRWSQMSFVGMFALFPRYSTFNVRVFHQSIRLLGSFSCLCFPFVPTDLLPPVLPTFLSIHLSHPPTSVFLCVIISCACSPSPPLFIALLSILLFFMSPRFLPTCFPSLLSHLFLPSFFSFQVLLSALPLSTCLPSSLTFIQVMNNFWADPALPQQVAYTLTEAPRSDTVHCK